MPVTTLSSRELSHDISRAKKAAESGPVIITEQGKPSHVLLTYGDFTKLAQAPGPLIEALSMPGLSDIDFRPERARRLLRETDFS